MGCFSFICKCCNRPIRSDSFRGERVYLFLLKDGKVIESLLGEYDSYGRVFDSEGNSVEWETEWDAVCDLMFSPNQGNGIAAIHGRCITYAKDYPSTRSEHDPNQGWGPFQTDDFEWHGLDMEENEEEEN